MLVTSCLLQLLVSFFMEGKCSAACAAWCAEACHQLSNLIFVFCGSKPSSEATPYDIKYPLLSSGRPETDRKPEKSSERKRERRENNLLEKLVEKFRKKNQGREVSLDDPFSPSCLAWLYLKVEYQLSSDSV
ncbi:hypothetical protein YC2023_108253 [Brassica napus]